MLQRRRSLLLTFAAAAACAGPRREPSVDSAATRQATPQAGQPAPASASSASSGSSASSAGCVGLMLNVMLTRAAFTDTGARSDSVMRVVAARLLASVHAPVVHVDISPAIRVFRVTLPDSATAVRVARGLRASGKTEDVSSDDCSFHKTRP